MSEIELLNEIQTLSRRRGQLYADAGAGHRIDLEQLRKLEGELDRVWGLLRAERAGRHVADDLPDAGAVAHLREILTEGGRPAD